jgi:HSP20 family protein
MTMERWDPRSELAPLRDAIERLMEDSFVGLGRFNGLAGFGRIFPIDIRETDTEFIIEAQLPGFNLEEMQVSANGDTLTIQATHKTEQTEREGEHAGSYIRRERYEGQLRRSLTLPDMQANAVQATYQNGVLTLHAPKGAQAKASVIPIKALP